MFSKLSKTTLARAVLTKNAPVYVQFYVTARCNLACQQCNVIYANADVPECTLDDVKRIAENFAELGVAIVLLTGGEPFVRKDLPEIIREFESRGVHVRMQTNAAATEEQIHRAIDFGGTDISISLDTLRPAVQDQINGGFEGSWNRALLAMARFTKYLPREGSFASLGCVLQRENLGDIVDVVRFGTETSWYTSLVPVHVTDPLAPLSFRTFDRERAFRPDEFGEVERVVETVRGLRREGYLLYDSDQYLDDILRFVRGEPIQWRDRNAGVCDSPNLYFAVLPNGDFAPCCDHRLASPVSAASPDFPRIFRDRAFRAQVHDIAAACPGCMYGSYPEMTIAMRFAAAKLDRLRLFFTSPPAKRWPFSHEALLATAERIRSEPRDRARLPTPPVRRHLPVESPPGREPV